MTLQAKTTRYHAGYDFTFPKEIFNYLMIVMRNKTNT